ncbi:TetR/AcrR family transcriptional regulator [Cupriavidus sp. 30B13]|uniref:TetR/AcrR family transcriptional regulator n=1 Tax=Cupriavidus sp. 30B13 TaxID=3384241 RepID=UPI003B90C79E
MKGEPAPTPRPTGRPLSFDRDAALQAAMLLFWRRGYEAASISDLTAAMGITPPSLYTAFGDKKRLFLEAVARYLARPGLDVEPNLQAAPTAREAIGRLLQSATVEQTRRGQPRGCMLMSAAVSSPVETEVQEAVVRLRGAVERALCERIARGIADGELPAGTDAGALAGFYLAILQGMSTQARDGASRGKLCAIADAALAAWPARD